MIRESSRRQTLSLAVTSLDAIVRHYMATHDNNTPPTRALPKQPMCLRELFVSDCSVLRSRDGANNEHPYAHLVCLHPSGAVRKEEVIESFAYVRPVNIDDDNQQTIDAREEMFDEYEVSLQLGEDDLVVWDQEIIAQPTTVARAAKQTRRVRRMLAAENAQDEDTLQSASGSGRLAPEAQLRGKQQISRKRVAKQSEKVTSSPKCKQPYGSLPSTDGLDVMDAMKEQDQAEQSTIGW